MRITSPCYKQGLQRLQWQLSNVTDSNNTQNRGAWAASEPSEVVISMYSCMLYWIAIRCCDCTSTITVQVVPPKHLSLLCNCSRWNVLMRFIISDKDNRVAILI
jgi:hypothetical protein